MLNLNKDIKEVKKNVSSSCKIRSFVEEVFDNKDLGKSIQDKEKVRPQTKGIE